MLELTSWDQVREALRSKHLRQAGYSEGAVITQDTLLDLHGADHRDRRRVENRLFRRSTFARWENETLGATIDASLRPFVAAGRGDLAQIGYRAAMNLTATIAGIDLDPFDGDRTDQLYRLVKKFSEGATLMHSTRDKAEVRSEVRSAMAEFRSDFYEPAHAARQERTEDPVDVLGTLLLHQDTLELADEVLFREICFYLQAGAHSTANAFTHTVDDVLQWTHAQPVAPELSLAFLQRCMHESLRLKPASPVAYRTPLQDVVLSDGTLLNEGQLVVLNLTAANTDETVFGPNADGFDPWRTFPEGIAPWGLSFGGGTHACVGAELDGGLEPDPDRPVSEHLFGTVAVIAHAFFAAGGRPDPVDPPTLDPSSTRRHFDRYPVLFG